MAIHQALVTKVYNSPPLSLSLTQLGSGSSDDSASSSYSLDIPVSSVVSTDLVVIAIVSETSTSSAVGDSLNLSFTASNQSVSVTEIVGNMEGTTASNEHARVGIFTVAGSALSGETTLTFELELESGNMARIALRAFTISNATSSNLIETKETSTNTSSANMSHTIAMASGRIGLTAAYFAQGSGHTLSGHSTTYTGVSDFLGSGDFGSSDDKTSATTITYTRGSSGNTQGSRMVSAVFG